MITTLTIITSLSIVLVVYHHIGYPILLKLAYRFNRNTMLAEPVGSLYEDSSTEKVLPYITIIMPAYNEAAFIAEKIRNLACLDYPKKRFEIILAADGCTDNTVAIAKQVHTEANCKGLQLNIRDFSVNCGKTQVINKAMKESQSDLIAFTDVSSLISIDALKIAVTRFQNPTIGAVNGNYRLVNPGSQSEAAYWRYQSQIKIGEEALGSVLGAHGGFYMIRRKLVKALPSNAINDDFLIPMRAITQGYNVVHEPRLNVIELEKSTAQVDWHRRVRISMGNLQQILWLHEIFHPRYRGIALAFFSGKGLRVAMPFLMLASFIGSWLLAFMPLFFGLAILQTMAYTLALCVHLKKSLAHKKLLGYLYYLVIGHTAGLVGVIRYLQSADKRYW